MSLRARVVNSLYRYGLKPTMGPDLTLEGLRSRAQRLERLSGRPPRGTRINRLNLGTFVAEEIIPAAGPEDRTHCRFAVGPRRGCNPPSLFHLRCERCSTQRWHTTEPPSVNTPRWRPILPCGA